MLLSVCSFLSSAIHIEKDYLPFEFSYLEKLLQVKHGNCGPVQSFEVQRQLVARTPVFYRLEDAENGTSIGYIHLKEFNALAIKDIVTGEHSLFNLLNIIFLHLHCFVYDVFSC